MERVFRGLDQCSEEEKIQRLLKLKLRFFTPREVANVMGFPQGFCKSKSFTFLLTYIILDLFLITCILHSAIYIWVLPSISLNHDSVILLFKQKMIEGCTISQRRSHSILGHIQEIGMLYQSIQNIFWEVFNPRSHVWKYNLEIKAAEFKLMLSCL